MSPTTAYGTSPPPAPAPLYVKDNTPRQCGPRLSDDVSNRLPLGPPQRPRSRDEFQVAIICALPLEADAVELTFDQDWPYNYGRAGSDRNFYSYGSIGSF